MDCANVFMMCSSNSFKSKVCACASIAFLAAIISCSVDSTKYSVRSVVTPCIICSIAFFNVTAAVLIRIRETAKGSIYRAGLALNDMLFANATS